VNCRTKDGETLLHYADEDDEMKILLIKNGADISAPYGHSHSTPLDKMSSDMKVWLAQYVMALSQLPDKLKAMDTNMTLQLNSQVKNKVHKEILSKSSKKFKSMISEKVIDVDSEIVIDVSPSDSDLMKKLTEFLYGDMKIIEHINGSVSELIKVSDLAREYEVDSLLQLCITSMWKVNRKNDLKERLQLLEFVFGKEEFKGVEDGIIQNICLAYHTVSLEQEYLTFGVHHLDIIGVIMKAYQKNKA